MEDRCGDLAPDIVTGRTVVGIGEDVGHELGRPGGGGAPDDADADVDPVERAVVAGDTDHLEVARTVGQVHRDERDLELPGHGVDDTLDDLADRA